MSHLVPVIIVSLIVAFLMYKNINKITANIDTIEDNTFGFYSKYSRIVERYIDEIREIVDKNSVLSDDRYKLKDETKRDEIKEELSSNIRKLAYFETLQAKNRDKKELETEFFKILSSVDHLIKENFINGEELADELRENLHKEYEKLKNGFVGG